MIPKSPAAIIAMLAILKADCIYVPIDPEAPALRTAKILKSCESRCILASGRVAGLLDELFLDENLRSSTLIGSLGEDCMEGQRFRAHFSYRDTSGYSDEPLDCRNTESDPAHIMFTSGSTGVPKGVVITHSNVIHFVNWAVRYFGIGPSDRISGHPPLHFDLSTFDIFGTFKAGAQLHPVPPELSFLPNTVADFIRRHELTQWFSVPSLLQYMARFQVVKMNDFPALRRLLWCGEVFATPSLIHWMKRLPHVQFTNLYGPTEGTIASSYYTLPACPKEERSSIPIGSPCDGEALFVLDENLNQVPPGQTAELFIAGTGLSPGYWKDEERTHAAFPFSQDAGGCPQRLYRTGDLGTIGEDGLIYFIGRTDSQIKSRGYRIELGEIEATMNRLEDVDQSAVVAIPGEHFEGQSICCAYSLRPGSLLNPRALRSELARYLPAYMLPAQWMELEQFPRNGNGKIDRKRVKELFVNKPDTAKTAAAAS